MRRWAKAVAWLLLLGITFQAGWIARTLLVGDPWYGEVFGWRVEVRPWAAPTETPQPTATRMPTPTRQRPITGLGLPPTRRPQIFSVPTPACPSPGPSFVDNDPYADFKRDVLLAVARRMGVDLARLTFVLDDVPITSGLWGLAESEGTVDCLSVTVKIYTPAMYFSEMAGWTFPGVCGEVSDPNTYISWTVVHELRHAYQFQHWSGFAGLGEGGREADADRYTCDYFQANGVPYPIFLY